MLAQVNIPKERQRDDLVRICRNFRRSIRPEYFLVDRRFTGIRDAINDRIIYFCFVLFTKTDPDLVSNDGYRHALWFKAHDIGCLFQDLLIVCVIPNLIIQDFNLGIFFDQSIQEDLFLSAMRAAVAPEEVNGHITWLHGQGLPMQKQAE